MYQDDDIGYVIDDQFDDSQINNNEFDEENIFDNNYNDDYENNPKSTGGKWVIIILSIILIILLFVLFKSFGKKEVNPQINIEKDQVYIKLSDTSLIQFNLINNDNNNIFWQSLNEEIVKVDNNGNATGINLGKTSVLATYVHSNYQNYFDECDVFVHYGEQNVNLVDVLVESEIRIKKGNTSSIDLNYSPSNALVYNIKYTILDNSIATISEDGKINANNVGKTTINIIVNEKINKTVNLEVYEENSNQENNNQENNNVSVNKKPTSVKFKVSKIDVMVNTEKGLLYTISPNTAKDYKVRFENSNNTILKIDNSGKIKGLSVGTSTIKIIVNDTLTDTIVVNVIPYTIPVEKIILKSNVNVKLNVGGTSQINYEISPTDASNKVVSFTSSNNNVAEVNENGVIKANGKGNCIITIKTQDGNKTYKINVAVN